MNPNFYDDLRQRISKDSSGPIETYRDYLDKRLGKVSCEKEDAKLTVLQSLSSSELPIGYTLEPLNVKSEAPECSLQTDVIIVDSSGGDEPIKQEKPWNQDEKQWINNQSLSPTPGAHDSRESSNGFPSDSDRFNRSASPEPNTAASSLRQTTTARKHSGDSGGTKSNRVCRKAKLLNTTYQNQTPRKRKSTQISCTNETGPPKKRQKCSAVGDSRVRLEARAKKLRQTRVKNSQPYNERQFKRFQDQTDASM